MGYMGLSADLFFFPSFFANKCPLCSTFAADNNLCFDCFSSLQPLSLACKKCQMPMGFVSQDIDTCNRCFDASLNFFQEMVCPFVYNSFLKQHLIALKNHQAFYLAKFFSSFLFFKSSHLFSSDSVIVPVPLHFNRLFKRGYNQSWLLAQGLAKRASISSIPDLLVRTVDTFSQSKKSYKQRIANVQGVFNFNDIYRKSMKDKKIFLIDDVITTGATIFECARVLKPYVKDVYLLAVGRRVLV